ncbi:MAG: tellurium resistance protein [Silicimonas sp.]|nr:tellurium resistance protein [Silicimonas sp.]
MSHFPPPPKLPPKTGLFRRVPPAVFPAVLGLLGLVSAWRHAIAAFGVPTPPVDMAIGAVSLLFLFCSGAYLAKVMLRPGALVDDVRTLPGRTGVATLCVGLMVEAGLLAQFSPATAIVLLLLGFTGLLVLALHVLPQRLRGTDTAGPPTPALHLVFVGFIVAPGAAVPLGLAEAFLPWLIWYCIAAAVLVSVVTMGPLVTGNAPVPLRPLQVIHLAPWAFFSMSANLTGQVVLAQVSLVLACLVALVLAVRIRWLTAGEFSGFWSAFTFPVTALAGAFLTSYLSLGFEPLRVAGGLVLVAVTLYVPVIAFKVLKAWASGTLAVKTNASIA